MANYATLKAAIADVIKTNGANAITGALLQTSLMSMIDSLGAGYQFGGVAIPSTNPGTPDYNVFYLAAQSGTYANFGGIELTGGEIAVFEFSGSWSKQSLPVLTADSVVVQENVLKISGNEPGIQKPILFNLTDYCYKKGLETRYFPTLQDAVNYMYDNRMGANYMLGGSMLAFAVDSSLHNYEIWEIKLTEFSWSDFTNVANWRKIVFADSYNKVFGEMPASLPNVLNAGTYMSFDGNIVNRYQQLVSLSVYVAAGSQIQVAIIDESTLEILGERVVGSVSGGVVTLTPEELPIAVNKSDRQLGLWVGAYDSDHAIVRYALGTGQVSKFLDMVNPTEIVTQANLYILGFTITKRMVSMNDLLEQEYNDAHNPIIQNVECGSKLISAGGSNASDWWANRDNIVNAFNKLVSITISNPLATGFLNVALVNEETGVMIESKQFSTVEHEPKIILPSAFDFDINNSTEKIGIYATPASNDARNLGYVAASGDFAKYYSNNVIAYTNLFFDIVIKKTLMNPAANIPEITRSMESKINQLEAEIGTGGQISDLQDYITNHRNVFLGAATYVIDTALDIPNNTKIVGIRGASVIQLGNANIIADLTAKQNISFENVTFIGKTPHNSHTSLGSTIAEQVAAVQNRTGAGVDKGFYISGAAQGITFNRCEFKNFGYSGLHFKQTHTGSKPFFDKFKVTDCEFNHSWFGVCVDVRCEFSTFVGNTYAYNEIGLFVDGGNNYFGVSHCDKNYINVVISGTSNNNDSHGSMVCCSLNHATLYGLMCVDVHNGFMFNGCMLYEQGVLWSNSKAIAWHGGFIDGVVRIDNEPQNQISMIHNTMFGVDYGIGIEGAPTKLSLTGNRFNDGRDASTINNNV